MKPSPLHSLLFFLPDELSNTTIYNIVIGILCILLAISLVALYRRIKFGSSFSYLEGMTAPAPTSTDPMLDPDVVDIQSQTATLQTTYDKLKGAADDQKNRIDTNSQTMINIIKDMPSKTNNITHANINEDDPSKTKIPNIDMS